MPIARIHFNRNFARKLSKNIQLSIPCISVSTGGKTSQFYSALIDTCTAIHGRTLNCGATAYLETQSQYVRVYHGGDWHWLNPEILSTAPDNCPNRVLVHPAIDSATASEFSFDSKRLALNKIIRSSTPLHPAILIQTPDLSFEITERFEFDRPLQIIQSHQTLSSTLFGGIAVFGITNSTLPE